MPADHFHYLIGLSVRGHRIMPDPRLDPGLLEVEFRRRARPGNYKRFLTLKQRAAAEGAVQSVASQQGGKRLASTALSTGVYAVVALPSQAGSFVEQVRALAYKRLRDKEGWTKGAWVFTPRAFVAVLDGVELNEVNAVVRLIRSMA